VSECRQKFLEQVSFMPHALRLQINSPPMDVYIILIIIQTIISASKISPC